jgi:hypothetical protein
MDALTTYCDEGLGDDSIHTRQGGRTNAVNDLGRTLFFSYYEVNIFSSAFLLSFSRNDLFSHKTHRGGQYSITPSNAIPY